MLAPGRELPRRDNNIQKLFCIFRSNPAGFYLSDLLLLLAFGLDDCGRLAFAGTIAELAIKHPQHAAMANTHQVVDHHQLHQVEPYGSIASRLPQVGAAHLASKILLPPLYPHTSPGRADGCWQNGR
jgi:hypothetical protein